MIVGAGKKITDSISLKTSCFTKDCKTKSSTKLKRHWEINDLVFHFCKLSLQKTKVNPVLCGVILN